MADIKGDALEDFGAHSQRFAPSAFILGKRLRSGDEPDGGGGAAVGGFGGFWAVPAARADLGQMWSFATQEMVMGGPLSRLGAQRMGEASAARVGNYLPVAPQGHLNLLASLSSGTAAAAGNGGRSEEDGGTDIC